MPLNFVYDSTALDFPKANAVPVGPDPTKEIDADHWNKVCQADYDLRDAIVMGTYFGFTSQAADPTPTNANKYWWLRNDDALVLQTPGHIYQVALGEVTAKGDILSYTGTKFTVLPTGGAGGDGKLLKADSTQPSGLAWLTPNYVTTNTVQTITAGKTFSTAVDETTVVIRQTSAPAPASSVFEVTDSGGGTAYLRVASAGIVAFSGQASFNGGWQLAPVGVGPGQTGEGRFLELSANGINFIGLKAPDAIGSSVSFVLPATDGASGQLLKTDGSAALSWASGGGDVSGVLESLTVAKLQGVAVLAGAPLGGDILSYDAGNTRWAPLSALTGDYSFSGILTENRSIAGLTTGSPIIHTIAPTIAGDALTGTNDAAPEILKLAPTFNLAATGGTNSSYYSVLHINPTETAIGTGFQSKSLILAQVGGSDKWKLERTSVRILGRRVRSRSRS